MAKLLTIINVFMLPKNFSVDFNDFFNSAEFMCKCAHKDCDTTVISELTIGSLYRSRIALGTALNLNSAFRCQKHNEAVGGSETSSHMKGLAVDVRKNKNPEEQKEVLEDNFDTVIEYVEFFHCHNNPEAHVHNA